MHSGTSVIILGDGDGERRDDWILGGDEVSTSV